MQCGIDNTYIQHKNGKNMRNTQKIQYLAAVLVAKTLTCGWK